MAGDGKEKPTGAYIDAVRMALGVLARSLRTAHSSRMIQLAEFCDPLSPNGSESVQLCVDVDPPRSEDLRSYLMKQMEYVQTFLVADRLGKQLDVSPPLMPPEFDLTPQIERILKVVGRGTGEPRESEELRYYPFPHLQSPATKPPFIDMAGFIVVLLTDYVRWQADDTPVVRAACAEIECALEFLLAPETYIEDGQGRIGWAFVPKGCCDETPTQPAAQQRHVFPTARAVVAIHRYGKSKIRSDEVMLRAHKIFDRVLPWLKSLGEGREGLFLASDHGPEPYFADHVYLIEALLSMYWEKNYENGDVQPLAIEAVRRALDELQRQQVLTGLDRTITHRVPVRGEGELFYQNRATRATCLSTLSQGMGLLRGESGQKDRDRARRLCRMLASDLLRERRNNIGLWPKEYVQFHWVVGAVEALLRFSRFVPEDSFQTSVEKIELAADMVLNDQKFREGLRKLLVDRIRELSTDTLRFQEGTTES